MRLVVFGHNDWWTWRAQGFCGRNAALVRALARREEVESVASWTRPAIVPARGGLVNIAART